MRNLVFFLVVVLICSNPALARKKKQKKEVVEVEEITGPVIGIDLGTTYSCVGIFRSGNVEIIPNDQGNRITPSYVAFTPEGERLIGDAAKNQASSNPTNTVFDIKRFMGRSYTEKSVQADIKMMPYRVVNKNSKPYVQIEQREGAKKTLSPEEISSYILTKMKNIAEDFLGEPVKNAVITVPAYFNDQQRQATHNAGTIAGLNVLRIINEPTAAALAYGLDRDNDDVKILVYDLGGGTFDVSVLTIDGGIFEVMATNGDTHLGGEDFDHRIVKHFIKYIDKKMGVDVSKDKRAVAKLKRGAELAKRGLSTLHEVKFEVEGVADGQDLSATLTRAKFEQLNKDLFERTLAPVKRVLKDAGLDKKDIDEIVLVGGSTRIPKVQAMLRKFFNGKELNKGVNPDEAVAYGAAVQAGVLAGEGGESTNQLLLLDVTPLTMGIELTGGVYLPFIERNSVIPTKVQKMVTTEKDYQTTVPITIFQGERKKARDNVLLGEFHLSGLPPLKKGQAQVEVTFQIDANGILQVSAVDKATNKHKSISITSSTGKLSKEEIERMVRQAEKYAEQDQAWQDKIDAHNKLEQYIYQMRNSLKETNIKDNIDDDDKVSMVEALDKAEEWLERDDPRRDLEDYEAAQEELQDVCDPIVSSLYGTDEGGEEDGEGGYDEDGWESGDDDEEWDEDYHNEL